MPRCALQNCIGGNRVIHDHGGPTGRVALRADDGAEIDLAALLQDFKEDLHLALIAQRVEQEVIKDEEGLEILRVLYDALYATVYLRRAGNVERRTDRR